MPAKLFALLLLTLTLSPFTAPFAACDLATLVAESAGQEPVSAASPRRSPTDAAVVQVVTARRAVGRVKLIAWLSHAARQTVSNPPAALRVRFSDAGRVTTSPPLQTVLRI